MWLSIFQQHGRTVMYEHERAVWNQVPDPVQLQALTHVSSPLFPTQTALETPTRACVHSLHKFHGRCSHLHRSWDRAQLHAASENPGDRLGTNPSTPLPAKPTPGAAQGVGTGLQESYQFVWCHQQHCHVHTDMNVQISAEFDGWADGRQVIKSIWLENHCHFQLQITPANSYHNFVLFSVKLEYQTKWWCSFLGRSCKIFSNSTLIAV